MTDSDTADPGRMNESADMVEIPAEGDPADLTQTAAEGTADKMHDEVDQIAEDADATSAGHGPVTSDPDKD
ncbi:MAG: hypothetical protein WKF47_01885 [Geodermatophilaceae bacterium]